MTAPTEVREPPARFTMGKFCIIPEKPVNKRLGVLQMQNDGHEMKDALTPTKHRSTSS